MTVDVQETIWSNTIDATEMITVWVDPDFNPKARVFYYGLVIEIPTLSWAAYDAKFYMLNDLGPKISIVIQKRAYTPPIC